MQKSSVRSRSTSPAPSDVAANAEECSLLRPDPGTLAAFPRQGPSELRFVPNRRRFSRIPLDLDCDLEFANSTRLSGRTRDVSLKGIFLRSADQLPLGANCTATLFFEGRASELSIEVNGRIARNDATGIGIEFVSMGMESLHHLRNLVRYNAPDVAGVESEFASNLGLNPRIAA